MKTPILTAALIGTTLFAVPAMAQQRPATTPRAPVSSTGAVSLPDPFAQPGAQGKTAPPASPARQAPATATTGTASDIARSEKTLRGVITAISTGRINYSVFSTDLATKIRTQAPQMTPLIQQFGPIRSVQHRGQQNGADMFRIVFENQATDWIIGFNDEDQIAALLFRPAED